jgi:hypothetical protein
MQLFVLTYRYCEDDVVMLVVMETVVTHDDVRTFGVMKAWLE